MPLQNSHLARIDRIYALNDHIMLSQPYVNYSFMEKSARIREKMTLSIIISGVY